MVNEIIIIIKRMLCYRTIGETYLGNCRSVHQPRNMCTYVVPRLHIGPLEFLELWISSISHSYPSSRSVSKPWVAGPIVWRAAFYLFPSVNLLRWLRCLLSYTIASNDTLAKRCGNVVFAALVSKDLCPLFTKRSLLVEWSAYQCNIMLTVLLEWRMEHSAIAVLKICYHHSCLSRFVHIRFFLCIWEKNGYLISIHRVHVFQQIIFTMMSCNFNKTIVCLEESETFDKII